MPLYSFICEECGSHFDRRLPYTKANFNQRCPNGHKRVRRVYSVPSVVFKGNGFYSTDNRPKKNQATR